MRSKNSSRGRALLLVGIAALSAVSTVCISLATAEITGGKATYVGVDPEPGEHGDALVGITARFADGGILDLGALRLTITALLNETAAIPTPTPTVSPTPTPTAINPGDPTPTPTSSPTPTVSATPIAGADDLVRGYGGAPLLSVTLSPRSGSSATRAIYESPGSERPAFRVSARRRADGTIQLSIKVNRASIPDEPSLCAGDPLSTKFATILSFSDGTNPPVFTQVFVQPWLCLGDRLRTASVLPAPSPAPGLPIAKLKVDQITRETGVPNRVRLDATSSSDSDGTIDEYTFSVLDRRTNTAIVPSTTQVGATLEAILPPGDYIAHVTVKDNDDRTAKGSRGFSLH